VIKMGKTKIPLHKKWKRIDAWRGYYTYDNSIAGGAFLYGNDTHNELEKERIKKIKSLLRKNKIPYRFKISKTSNVFSVGYDIIVAPKDVKKAKQLLRLANLV